MAWRAMHGRGDNIYTPSPLSTPYVAFSHSFFFPPSQSLIDSLRIQRFLARLPKPGSLSLWATYARMQMRSKCKCHVATIFLILKAAIWQNEHWVDRSAFLKVEQLIETEGAAVVLLSLDRDCAVRSPFMTVTGVV